MSKQIEQNKKSRLFALQQICLNNKNIEYVELDVDMIFLTS